MMFLSIYCIQWEKMSPTWLIFLSMHCIYWEEMSVTELPFLLMHCIPFEKMSVTGLTDGHTHRQAGRQTASPSQSKIL